MENQFNFFSILQNKLNKEIEKATLDNQSKGKIYLGKVSEKVVIKIKSLVDIDVSNRIHVLSDNDIRHMLNEHGDPKKESKKNQIAITENDISKIPEIINFYDNIENGNDNKSEKTIRYIKNYDDGITYLVEVIPEKSKTLKIKTMWKKPTRVAN